MLNQNTIVYPKEHQLHELSEKVEGGKIGWF
jgi:hypothetical protein